MLQMSALENTHDLVRPIAIKNIVEVDVHDLVVKVHGSQGKICLGEDTKVYIHDLVRPIAIENEVGVHDLVGKVTGNPGTICLGEDTKGYMHDLTRPSAIKNEIEVEEHNLVRPSAIKNEVEVKEHDLEQLIAIKNEVEVEEHDLVGKVHGNQGTICLGELEQWLRDNSVVPEDPYEAFVIAYDILETELFRFVISSKYLLQLARDVDNLHVDPVSKLIWQGYSVLPVGTTDKQHKFHPLCLAVFMTEQKEDFRMIFKSMKDKIQLLFSSDFKPKILVTDGMKNVEKAFTEEFKDATVRTCWTHAKRNLKGLLIESDVEQHIQQEMLNDFDVLHSITNQNAFNTAFELFLQKHIDQSTFITYFKEQWLLQNLNWYLGAAPMSPSTNNALEVFITILKSRNILHELSEQSSFLMLAKQMIKQWTTKYIANSVEHFIAKSPIVSLKVWIDSYYWALQPIEIKAVPCDDKDFICYLIPDGEAKNCTFFENHPKTFDEFKEQFFSKWEVRLPVNKQQWAHGKCTCPTYFRMYMCKHVIGLAIRLNHVTPDEAKIIICGQKRQRGRPPKARIFNFHNKPY